MIESVFAQSIPNPSIPEFTVKFEHSYYIKANQKYDNNTITVIIKNQPYTYSMNGTIYQVFYNIWIKNHSKQEWTWDERWTQGWTELYPIGTYYGKEFTSYLQEHYEAITNNTPIQSNSEYTYVPLTYYDPPLDGVGNVFPIILNTTLDFKVKALVGHSTQGWVADYPTSPVLGGHYTTVIALDTSSNWSDIQTIIIPASGASSSSSPSLTPIPNSTSDSNSQYWQFAVAIGAPVGIIIIIVSLLIYFKKHKH